MSHPYPAARVVLIYGFFAALWILLSNRALARLSTTPQVLNLLQTYKSWAFVAVTAALLYVVCRRAEHKARRVNQALEMISACRQALGRATDEPSLVRQVCQLIVDAGGYERAWVDFAEQNPGEATIQATSPAGHQTTQRGHALSIALPLADRTATAAPHAFGTLNICATEPAALSTEKTRLLMELANDLAQGIIALRARAEHQRAEQELRRRVRELGALNSIVATVSQSLDINQILNDTLDKMLQVMQLEGEIKGAIFLLNERAGELRLAALRGLPVEFGERETAIRLDTCLCGRVVETGEIIDATRVNAWPERPGWVEPHGHLLVPLKSKGKTMGVVSLYLPDTCHPSDSEMQLLAAIGNQIGVSVENAKLYERLEEQALGLELLYEVGRRFSSSSEPQGALGQMVRRCAQVLEADACLLQLIEGDQLIVRASHYSDDAKRAEAEKWILSNYVHVGKAIVGQLVATGQPAVSGSVDLTSMLTQDDTDDWWRSRDWILAPLRAQDRTVGVLTLIARHKRRSFSEHDLALVQEIANQAAAALENARLYQKTTGSLDRLWALSQISRAINSSLDLDQVLTTIAHYAAELSGSDAAGIYELDKKQQTLRISASHNARPEFVQAVNSENIRVGQWAIGRAAATHGSVTALDTRADPDLPFPPLDAQEGYRSILAVPMLGRDALIGGIVLWRRQPQPFDEDIVRLISTLADQSVVAIENARLYQEANQRLEEVSLIRAVALEGAAGRPFDEIVADATQRLRHLWASHHLGFLFPDETGALRVHTSYVGLPPKAQRTLRLPSGQGLTSWVFQTGRPVVVSDVRLNPRYISTSPETRSEMDAPLLVGDHVIGVINVESTHLDAFSAHDVHLLTALAGQLALLLDNAQAHRDLAERAQQLQAAFYELAEAERLKDQLVRNISHELRTPMTFLKGYVELLRDETFGPLSPALRKPLEIVSEKTCTVAHLVERIVDLQTVRPDTLALEPLRLTQVIQEAADRWTCRAQQAGIQLQWSLPVDLPPVVGDRQRLAEALDNLLGNAIKFNGKDGQVTIKLRTEHETAHLEIADTGVGIPSDKLVRIFDRFYQVDGTTRRRFGGAGVGLALVKQIVEAHGGQVWAESPGLGQGSTFHLVLPTAPAPWVKPPFDSSALLVYNSLSAG